MSHRDQVAQTIREILATEEDAISLSDQLFSLHGLFGRLATTEEERRALVQTPLFRDALRRLSELQRREATAFAQAVGQARPALTEGTLVSRLVRAGAAGSP